MRCSSMHACAAAAPGVVVRDREGAVQGGLIVDGDKGVLQLLQVVLRGREKEQHPYQLKRSACSVLRTCWQETAHCQDSLALPVNATRAPAHAKWLYHMRNRP
jgi:hypothetical protein